MNTKLVIAVVAVLNVGVLAGCSKADDPSAAQAAALAPAPVTTVAPATIVEPVAAPVVAAMPASTGADPAHAPTFVTPSAPPKPAPVAKRAPQYAKVVSVTDATQTISEPREVCHDEQVVKQAPVQDEHRVAGTVAGAAAGAVIGNQIGDGKGRKIARIVGIVGGAVAGNKIQQKMQEADTVTTTERRCETVTETRDEHVGYDVTYTYAGRTATVRMQRKPGATLPVKNGEVVVS